MAAGLGFKTFTTGEVLTAGDVNGYLMQGVLVFASAAARDAAITSPQEGQFAYTKDTNGLWYYDGSAWVASGATGDIEGVTAGVGISGGGTSGTVTITNSMATAIDAKGDLVAGTGADTFARLAVGTNGQVLAADSTASTGLTWSTISSGGMTQLATGNLTGSATIRLQSIPSTYKFCRLYIRNHIATNTNLSLRFRLNNDSTANRYSSGGETGQNVAETFRYDSVYCTSDLSNYQSNGMAVFEIHDYTNTTTWKMFSAMAIGTNKTTSTSIQLGSVVGAYNQTGAITEIDIFSDQGNWTGGTYTLYGVN